jgi:hypothetical protein
VTKLAIAALAVTFLTIGTAPFALPCRRAWGTQVTFPAACAVVAARQSDPRRHVFLGRYPLCRALARHRTRRAEREGQRSGVAHHQHVITCGGERSIRSRPSPLAVRLIRQQIVDAVLYLTNAEFTTGTVIPADGVPTAGRYCAAAAGRVGAPVADQIRMGSMSRRSAPLLPRALHPRARTHKIYIIMQHIYK